MAGNYGTTRSKVLIAAERRARAWELRKTGLSYPVIAMQMYEEYLAADKLNELTSGWGAWHVYKDISTILNEYRSGYQETVLEVAEMEIHRLDELQTAVWTKAKTGSLEAIDRVLKIMDRRAQLIGLDKPVKIDWRIEVKALLDAGKVSLEDVRRELGDELATNVIESYGDEGTIAGEIEESSKEE